MHHSHCSDFSCCSGRAAPLEPLRALRAAIQGDCGQLMYDHIMPSFLLIFSEGKTSEASLENAVDSSRY